MSNAATAVGIPVLDLTAEIQELWDDLRAAMDRVVRSGQFIMGPDVQAFEREAAAYLGVRHAVAVNSGTDALVIALRALGVGPGDEVVTTPFSFFATAESISAVGAKPVFVDIEPDGFNLDPDGLEERIGPRTKALLPVHLYGRPCRIDDVMEVARSHGLSVLEDCAQSFGARSGARMTGTFGDAGAYSFFPSKNLGAFGDAGLIVTERDDLADVARMLRAHGGKKKYHNEMVGYNSRMDSLQAAILRVKLPHVERWNERRRAVARAYDELLRGTPGVTVPEVVDGHVFHQYTVRIDAEKRDGVAERLAEENIGTMIYYPTPQDRLPLYLGRHPANPVSDRCAREVLSLPMGPSLSPEEQRRVADALRAAVA